jgi:hypothetical protein
LASVFGTVQEFKFRRSVIVVFRRHEYISEITPDDVLNFVNGVGVFLP